MHSAINRLYRRFSGAVQNHIKRWLKPHSFTMVGGSAVDLTRSKTELIAENTFLRQQLIILQRQSKRPQLSDRDRFRLLLLARATPYWKQALLSCNGNGSALLRTIRIVWQRRSKPRSAEPGSPQRQER